MQWLLDNSPWIIATVGAIHVICFIALWRNRTRQARQLEAHLRNIVGAFSTHMDVDAYSTLDERIDGFVHDIREVLRDPNRREDQRKLYYRLVTKEESKKVPPGQDVRNGLQRPPDLHRDLPFLGHPRHAAGHRAGVHGAGDDADDRLVPDR